MVGIVSQQTALDRYLPVDEMLALWNRYCPRRRPVHELLELAGLEDKATARVRDLPAASSAAWIWRSHYPASPN